MYAAVEICFWAAPIEHHGRVVSAAETKTYPIIIETRAPRANASVEALKSESSRFNAPSRLIERCFPSRIGLLYESRPSIVFVTFDSWANSTDFLPSRPIKRLRVASDGWCSSCRADWYLFAYVANNPPLSCDKDAPKVAVSTLFAFPAEFPALEHPFHITIVAVSPRNVVAIRPVGGAHVLRVTEFLRVRNSETGRNAR